MMLNLVRTYHIIICNFKAFIKGTNLKLGDDGNTVASAIGWTPEYTLNFAASLDNIPPKAAEINNLLSLVPDGDFRQISDDPGLPTVHIAYNNEDPVFCIKLKDQNCDDEGVIKSKGPIDANKNYNFALRQERSLVRSNTI